MMRIEEDQQVGAAGGAGARLVPLRRPARRGDPGPEPAAAAAAPGDLGELVREVAALEAVVVGWDDERRGTVRALQRAIDALHKEALARMIRALRAEPAAAGALRRAVSDPAVYGILRHHGLVRPSLQERVEAALASVRPMLKQHGGDVELVEVRPPDSVTVQLLGSCDGCPSAGLTVSKGVEKAIREQCPEIRHIKQTKGGLAARPAARADYVSPFARADDAGWVRAARLDAIPEGGVAAVEVGGRRVLLARFGEGVRCYENACAHLGMPLDGGAVEDGVLTCPHHMFRYALDSGECLTVPGVQLQTHAVRVVAGAVEVKLS